MHVVYRHHEGRAWIYKVQKLYRRARITFKAGNEHLRVRGRGFRFKARVTLYYHGAKRGVFKTDRDGAFSGADPAAVLRPPQVLAGRDRQLRQLRVDGGPGPDAAQPPGAAADRAAGRGARPGRAPRNSARAGTAGPQPAARSSSNMPKQTPVGDSLPVKVRVSVKDGGRLRALCAEPPVLPDLLPRRKDAGAVEGAGHEHARHRVPAGRGARAAGLLQAVACSRPRARPPRTGDADLQGPAALIARPLRSNHGAASRRRRTGSPPGRPVGGG